MARWICLRDKLSDTIMGHWCVLVSPHSLVAHPLQFELNRLLVGFDMTVHMSEESKNPSIAIPDRNLLTTAVAVIFGWGESSFRPRVANF